MTTLSSGNLILAGLTATLTIVFCGCSVLAPQPDRSRYFVLTPMANEGSAVSTGANAEKARIAVGLGPIGLPRYLNRPEVVTRLTNTEFSLSDTDRWGEPLDVNVSRVLTQDVSADAHGLDVVQFPWSKKIPIEYRVSVDFIRLEKTEAGNAEVQAVWTVRRGLESNVLQSGETIASHPAGSDQRSASTALSEGVADVGREIARALEQQSQQDADTSRQSHL